MNNNFFSYLRKNILYIFLFSLFDSLLVFSYFLINDLLKDHFSKLIYNFYLLLSTNSKDLFSEIITHKFRLSDYPKLRSLIFQFFKLNLIKYIILFVIVILFTYLMWFLIYRLYKTEVLKRYYVYLGLWLFVLFIFFIVFENLDLIIKIHLLMNGVKRLTQSYMYGSIGVVMLSYFFLVLPISLNTDKKFKNTFKGQFVLGFFVLGLILFIFNTFVLWVMKFSFVLALILTLFLLMPLIMVYRYYVAYDLLIKPHSTKKTVKKTLITKKHTRHKRKKLND